MNKYFFMHPKTFVVREVHSGRSLWEDRVDKAEFVVAKIIGPAMEHCDLAFNQIDSEAIDDIETALSARGYPGSKIDAIVKKLQE